MHAYMSLQPILVDLLQQGIYSEYDKQNVSNYIMDTDLLGLSKFIYKLFNNNADTKNKHEYSK